jgi:hypothetical protein
MTLTIVFDNWSGGHAVYIDGMCRGNWDDGCFEIADLVECYEAFARDQSVLLERIEIKSDVLEIYDDEDGVDWPEQLGQLL